MVDIVKRIEELMDLFDEGEVTTANKIQRPSDPFREFEERNPMSDGGRIKFQGGTDTKTGQGFQPGVSKANLKKRLNSYNDLKKIYGKKAIEEAFKNQFGVSFEEIATKKEHNGRTVTNIIDGFKKKIKGINRSSATSPIYNEKTGHIFKTANRFGTFYSKFPGKNQYPPMRSLEEVQKAIDNAPPIEIDGQLFEQNPKDLRGDSEFSGKEVVTRKEQDKYGDKLKYKARKKKRIVPQTQAYYDRRARELAKSNPTILKKLSGKDGYQLSHLSLSELDSLKNLGYLPANINIQQYFPFEKKIVEISQQVYETQNDKKLSVQEKRNKIAKLQRKDRELRKKFPEFAKTKARLNVRATGLDPSGLMIKEKLPDPSIAIAPTEAGTQLKGTAVGSEKGKAILEFGKNNLQKLAAIGCPGKMMGGRVKLAKGENLSRCAVRGINKLKSTDPKNLTLADKANYQAIRKTSQGARVLKNVLGPAALAIEALFVAPFAAADYASGRRGRDIALSALSLGLADQKLRRDELKEYFPEYGKGQELLDLDERLMELERQQKGTRGQRIRSKGKLNIGLKKFDEAIKELPTEESLLDNLEKSRQAEQDLAKDEAERKKQRRSSFDLSDPFSAAGGGIAKLAGVDSGPPPPAGPNSQGLQGLMKRVKKL